MERAADIPVPFRTLVSDELRPGELAVWFEQPVPGLFARRYIGAFVFGLIWSAFMIFLAAGTFRAAREHGQSLSIVFLALQALFAVAGACMLLCPLWAWRKARRTVYVLTDQRAIIFDPGWSGSMTIRSFAASRLDSLRKVQHRDGSGDVIFDREWRKDSDGTMQSTDHGFLAVRNVKAVEALVTKLSAAFAAESALR